MLLRSRHAPVTTDSARRSRSAQLIRRGCPSHVASAAWMWHPRRMDRAGKAAFSPELLDLAQPIAYTQVRSLRSQDLSGYRRETRPPGGAFSQVRESNTHSYSK